MDTAIVNIMLVFLICFKFVCQVYSHSLRKEAYMTVPQLISAAGYPVEEHNITTADGYTLVMHRIPGGKGRNAKRTGKKVVFIAHGLTGSSGDFVIMGPERSLGYILADAGYDVWLGNFRGTVYSSHAWLTKKDPAFWEFSFHEHGKFDAPAMIDKVLQVTGLPKLVYVGYSMGMTSFFIMMDQWPGYNKKVVACVALGPAVYFDNFKLEAKVLMGMFNIPGLMRLHGRVTASLGPKMMEDIANNVCSGHSITTLLCVSIVYSMVGISRQADYDKMPVLTARLQPASWRQLEHYGKIAMTGVFTSWEDGLWGVVKPYNLANVKVPVIIIYGDMDRVSTPLGVKRLADDLKRTNPNVEVTLSPKFNHLDFIYAKDVGKLLNKPLVHTITKLYNAYGYA